MTNSSASASASAVAAYRRGGQRFLRHVTTPSPPCLGDVLAGISVAMVLIPQSMAYADLAGLPAYVGLFASAFPLLALALFASSPYLQTGPVAVTSLLTAGALAGSIDGLDMTEVVKLASLLAVIVGVVRALLGIFRLGVVAYLLAEPVMIGFTSGAGLIIMGSQLPKALGSSPPDYANPITRSGWALLHPGGWQIEAIALAGMTLVLMIGGRKIHKLFPGVLIAVIIGIIYSSATDYRGSTIGTIPEGLPSFHFDLPWGQTGALLLGGIVIALVGFAEPASIARTFAGEDGAEWSASQEFFSSGCANMVSGFTGAFPVGGSFSRSSVNRFAGAVTKWSGAVTGLVVLGFLPFAGVLEPLPDAVLGAIVVGAVLSLVKPLRLIGMWSRSKSQAGLTYLTFVLSLVTPPKVYLAVIVGVVAAALHHQALRFRVETVASDDDVLVVRPHGMLWFATIKKFQAQLAAAAGNSSAHTVQIDLTEVVSVDAGIADAIATVVRSYPNRTFVGLHHPEGSEALLQGSGLELIEAG